MRLMLLTADYPPDTWSGIGQAVERQAHGLSRIGAEVHVLYPMPRGREFRRSLSLGLRLHNLNTASFPINPHGFDWIHLHSLGLAELALEIRRRTGTRLAYTAHSILALELAGQDGAARVIEAQKHLMRICDAVILLSRSEREAALHFLPELSTRSFVVGNAVKDPIMTGHWGEHGPIVFAGRFARTKGIATLCGLLPRLHKEWSGLFIVAGGHGDVESCDMVKTLDSQMSGACQIKGWLGVDELERLLARASLVLVPSEYEPFGMMAVEAMRMGVPVLAANTGGLTETAGPGSGALLVDSHHPEDWLKAALQLLEDPTLSNVLRRRGPQWASQHFSETKIASQLFRCVYAA